MAFNIFFATLLAASAVAAPSPSRVATREYIKEDSYAPGWCTFHIHEDQSILSGTPDHKAQVWIYDANGELIMHQHQTLVTQQQGDGPSAIDLQPKSFDKPITFTLIDNKPDDATNGPEGWNFKYGDDSWSSKDKSRCSEGEGADSGSKENTGSARYSRDSDCGFTC